MNRALAYCTLFSVVCLVPVAARGQNGQDGSIVGWVYDQSGSPIKGVKVIATSETQIGGARTVYTNDDGAFRVVSLHPGTFEVKTVAAKLKPVITKDIRVGIGSPSEVNVVMEVETAVEEVKIIERAPIVNTSSAAIKQTMDIEFIESMPLDSRDNPHNQLIGAVAGAKGKSVRGGTDSQTIFTQDGFDMRENYPTMKTSAAYEILTGGHGADAPTASGGAVNLVTRSGSNKFEFEFNATGETSAMRFFLDPGERTNPNFFYVINPMISGPIIKDRLWFFANTEMHIDQDSKGLDPSGVFPQRDPKLKLINKGSFKLTWAVTPRNKLSSLTNFDFPREYRRKTDIGVDPEAQERRVARRIFTGLIWDSLLTDSMVLRSQVGTTYYGQHVFPELCVESPETCDYVQPLVQKFPKNQERDNSSAHSRQDTLDFQIVNRLEFFLDTKSAGSHGFQISSNYFTETDTTYTSTPSDSIVTYNGVNPESRTTYYSNDPRLEQARYGWFIQRVDWSRHVGQLRDVWRPTRHLTMTPAISHTWALALNSVGDEAMNNMAFVPSMSVAWDATHDGRTVLRTSASNYADVEVEDRARHTLGGRVSQKCNWNDSSGLFDKDCTYSGGRSRNTIGLPCGPSGVDLQGVSCREELQIPRTTEVTAGAEREIVSGVAVALDGIYRRFNHQYDTRETNRIWVPSGTGLDPFNAYKNGRNQTITDMGTPDYARREYMGATLGLRKREGRFKAQMAYTWSKLKGAAGDYGDNPGQDVYLYGYLGDDHRHEVKALAQYQTFQWLSLGLRYDFRTGLPYNRNFRNDVTGDFGDARAALGVNPGANVNDPADDRELRLPDQQSVNLQIRFNLMPLIRQRLDLYVDVLNLLATRTVTAVTTNDGPAFGLPDTRTGPMHVRLGLNYRY